MAEPVCTECGQRWWVCTRPALPLYPHGLIVHYCLNVRKVRAPLTVEEIAMVGASGRGSRLDAFPAARAYLEMLAHVAWVECESGCEVTGAQLGRLRVLWDILTEDERRVVRAEVNVFRQVNFPAEVCRGCGHSAPTPCVTACPIQSRPEKKL